MVVLVGAGKGLREYILNNGKEDIRYVYDNYTNKDRIEGIEVLDDLNRISENIEKFDVIVTAKSFNAKFELCYELSIHNIPYTIMYENIIDQLEGSVHIFGRYPDLTYEVCFDEYCSDNDSLALKTYKSTINFFKYMFERFKNDFFGKHIDVWVNFDDKPYNAYKQSYIRGAKHIFSYCTTYAIKDRVIPIPDYYSCYDEKEFLFEYTQKNCQIASEKKCTDNRAFFAGSVKSAPDEQRKMLKWLSDRYPEYIDFIEYSYWDTRGNCPHNHYLSMLEQTKYKYFIDIRGNGWADRTKILLQLGRPVFIVDRLFYDWFWDDLIPMKHYVPIKLDLSDLIEKIEYLDNHPDVYCEIVNNAKDFCRNHFSEKSYLTYLRNVTLKYGIRNND